MSYAVYELKYVEIYRNNTEKNCGAQQEGNYYQGNGIKVIIHCMIIELLKIIVSKSSEVY